MKLIALTAVVAVLATGVTPEEELKLLRADNKALRAALKTKNTQIDKLKAGLIPPELLPQSRPAATTKPVPPKKEPQPEPKFPYVSEALNKPCGKTEFEWRCLASRMAIPKAVKLCREFDAIRYIAEPKEGGLLIDVAVSPRRGVNISKLASNEGSWKALMQHVTTCILARTQVWVAEGEGANKPFDDFNDLMIRVRFAGKIIATRNNRGVVIPQ